DVCSSDLTREHYRVRDEREGAPRESHIRAYRYARSGFGEQTNPDASVWGSLPGARLERPVRPPQDPRRHQHGRRHVAHQPRRAVREREKTTEPFRSVDRAVAGATQEREHTGTQRQPHRNQQTIFVSVRVRGFCDHWRAAGCDGASARNVNWVCHGPDCCHDLFSVRNHWRYVARKSTCTSGTARLVSECSVYCAGRISIPPSRAAIVGTNIVATPLWPRPLRVRLLPAPVRARAKVSSSF